MEPNHWTIVKTISDVKWSLRFLSPSLLAVTVWWLQSRLIQGPQTYQAASPKIVVLEANDFICHSKNRHKTKTTTTKPK